MPCKSSNSDKIWNICHINKLFKTLEASHELMNLRVIDYLVYINIPNVENEFVVVTSTFLYFVRNPKKLLSEKLMVIRLLWNNKRIWIFSNWNFVNHKVRLAQWNEHFLIMKEIFVLFIIVVLYSNQFFSGSLPLIKFLLISKYFNGFFFK